jgi:glycosyltransferase involved in cell wall biosynthesis
MRAAMSNLEQQRDVGTEQAESNSLFSIIVTFFNEEKTIDAFFDEMNYVTGAMQERIEYVCVNDGSRDSTLKHLRAMQSQDSRIRIINLSRNFGKEAALAAGLAHSRGDAVIVIDADLQDPPILIPKFLEKWREGFDVVYGIRSSRRADTLLKRAAAAVFYKLFNSVADTRIPPGAGDFRLLDRRAVAALLALPERNRFTKGLFAWIGFRQTGVEFARGPRVGGSTSWSYWRLVNFAIDAVTSFSIVPLRIAGLIGVFVSLVGFGYAAFLMFRTLIQGIDVPGYASIMVVMMFLGGVQLVCVGLIGEYLGRLYIEAKARPLYVVADVFEASTRSE